MEKLKAISYEERLKYVEVLERVLESYENQRKNKSSNLQQILKNIEKQTQPLQGQISWKELELRINNLNPALFNKAGLSITYEVLKETYCIAKITSLLRKKEPKIPILRNRGG